MSLMHFLDVKKEDESLVKSVYFYYMATGLLMTLFGTVMPYLQEEYGIGYALIGTMTSAQQIGTVSAIAIAGFLPSLIGRKKTLVSLGVLALVGMFLMTVTGNPLMLILSFILVGITQGTVTNLINTEVNQHTGNSSGSLNMLHAIFAIGALTSPIIAMALGKDGWRMTFLIIGLFSLIGIVLCARSKMENEKEHTEKGGVLSRDPIFWINCFTLFFYLCAETCIVTWLVVFVKDTGLLTGNAALFTQSMVWMMMLIGRLGFASLTTRFDKNKMLAVTGTLMALFFILLISTKDPVLIFIAIIGEGLAMSGVYPTVIASQPKEARNSSISNGICMSIGAMGSIIMPIIVGQIAAATNDIRSGFVAILVAIFIMLALMIGKLFIKNRED